MFHLLWEVYVSLRPITHQQEIWCQQLVWRCVRGRETQRQRQDGWIWDMTEYIIYIRCILEYINIWRQIQYTYKWIPRWQLQLSWIHCSFWLRGKKSSPHCARKSDRNAIIPEDKHFNVTSSTLPQELRILNRKKTWWTISQKKQVVAQLLHPNVSILLSSM